MDSATVSKLRVGAAKELIRRLKSGKAPVGEMEIELSTEPAKDDKPMGEMEDGKTDDVSSLLSELKSSMKGEEEDQPVDSEKEKWAKMLAEAVED